MPVLDHSPKTKTALGGGEVRPAPLGRPEGTDANRADRASIRALTIRNRFRLGSTLRSWQAYRTDMSVTFADPRGIPATPPEPYIARFDPERFGSSAVRVGLLANGFPDSVAFLREVERAVVHTLEGRGRTVHTVFADKGNASAPASEAVVTGMAKEVQVVVTAYGH